jgi:hypothetical protein
MNIAHSIPSTVIDVSFSFLTSDDIRRISVKQIVNPVLLDDLNRPNIGGLYDPALGPSDRSDMLVGFFLLNLNGLIFFGVVAQHVTSPTSSVLVITATLNCRPQYSIHCLWEICSLFYVGLACFATGLN